MHLLIPYAYAPSEAFDRALLETPLPALGRLLARMEVSQRVECDEYDLNSPYERTLARELGLHAPDGCLPFAARWALHDGVNVGPRCWGLMTPVHLHMGTDQFTMMDPDLLGLTEDESRAFLQAVSVLFVEEGFHLAWGAPTRWYLSHDMLTDLSCASLDRVIGRNIDAWIPDHSRARLIRRLQNEVQMLLHAHPLNEAREARGLPVINSFWLSGCGELQAEKPSDTLEVHELLRDGLLQVDMAAWTAAWASLDAEVLAPAVKTLEAGELQALTLCGERQAVTLKPRQVLGALAQWRERWQLWRKPEWPQGEVLRFLQQL